jgi:hypothetical protein
MNSMSGKRVLKTPKEKEHGLMDETIKLYKYFQKLFQRFSGTEDVEKVDNVIYNLLEITKVKFFQIIKPLARFIYKNRNLVKDFKDRGENKKNDKIVLKRK